MRFAYSLALAVLLTGTATAQTTEPNAQALITPAVVDKLRAALSVETVRITLGAQNKRYGNLSQDAIQKLDSQWRQEREQTEKPLIAGTLSNPLSIYLARLQGGSLGAYAEIFVTDRNGLNAGQSSITSDFWQGDEDKFLQTFPRGAAAIFTDRPQWDAHRGIWVAQLSLTLTDQAGAPIGSATIDLNLTELERRRDLALTF